MPLAGEALKEVIVPFLVFIGGAFGMKGVVSNWGISNR